MSKKSDSINLFASIEHLAKEYNIEKEFIYKILEESLLSAYKKFRNISKDKLSLANIKIAIDPEESEIKIIEFKKVVEKPKDLRFEISLEQANEIDKKYKLGDLVPFELSPSEFSRKIAGVARQTFIAKIRDIKKTKTYREYFEKKDTIVTGLIQKIEKRNVIVELDDGKIDAVLPYEEQIPDEVYQPGSRMKFYIVDVKIGQKDINVYVSRTHPNLVKKLIEMEVPEIKEGIVEIKAIAREAGSRTKLAVWSNSIKIDPIGACIGEKGIRIQNVLKYLNGEKIDIVRFSDDPVEFIKNALSPAEVIHIDANYEEKKAFVLVPNEQLSLAIGKGGQNARLTAKLTNWKIDIKGK